MTTDTQLDQLAGVEAKVTVRDHEIVVREITMKHLREFAAACAPFLAAFDEAGALATVEGRSPDDFALFKVLAENGPAFMQAASLVTNAPVTFYEQLRPDEFFLVAAKVVEVNGNFFVRALAPALIQFAKGVGAIGSILSSASSVPGTAAVTSLTTPSTPSTVT